MSLMQSKLEQVFKEYIIFKEYVESNQKSQEELRTEIATEIVALEKYDEAYLELLFKHIGEKNLEVTDLDRIGARFRYYYDAYKDFIEIPDEIKTEAEKINIKFVYTIQDGEKKIADQELYENYKKQFLEFNKQPN